MKAKFKLQVSAVILSILALTVAACAKGTPAPSSPAATTTTKAATSSSPTTAPTSKTTPATTAPSAKPSTTAAQTEWDKWKASYDAEIAKLVDGAKKEGGKLTVYLPQEDQAYFDETVKYMKKNYGVDVEFVALRSSDVQAKVAAEQTAGKVIGDYVQGGSSYARRLNEKGYFDHYLPPAAQEPGVKWLVDPLLDKNEAKFAGKGLTPVVAMSILGVAVNTQLVPAEKMPKSYKDFAIDPFWKGKKIVITDPRTDGQGQQTLYYLDKLFGREDPQILQKFAAQEPVFQQDNTIASRGVATGLYMAMIGSRLAWVQPLQPAPIKLIFMKEGGNSSIALGCIVKGTTHPNAAKLFLNFQLSKDGQRLYTEFGGRTPIRADVKPAADENNASKWGVLPQRSYDDESTVLPKYLDIAKQLWPIK
ncbi:MAG: extracellular solute-binding protein [Chloroflexi bacterium]|nr:extracellular solute-binding protein [Chloroflexota bacterium]